MIATPYCFIHSNDFTNQLRCAEIVSDSALVRPLSGESKRLWRFSFAKQGEEGGYPARRCKDAAIGVMSPDASAISASCPGQTSCHINTDNVPFVGSTGARRRRL